jgi:hypothetical protein
MKSLLTMTVTVTMLTALLSSSSWMLNSSPDTFVAFRRFWIAALSLFFFFLRR